MSKRGGDDRLYLPPIIAERLAEFAKGKPQDEPLFVGDWHKKAGRMLRRDLNGTAKSGDGDRVDFHALRHSFISSLARTGASLGEMMDMARLSSAELIKRYSHGNDERRNTILSRLPEPKLPGENRDQTDQR